MRRRTQVTGVGSRGGRPAAITSIATQEKGKTEIELKSKNSTKLNLDLEIEIRSKIKPRGAKESSASGQPEERREMDRVCRYLLYLHT